MCVHASACQTEDAAADEINDSATHYAAAHYTECHLTCALP